MPYHRGDHRSGHFHGDMEAPQPYASPVPRGKALRGISFVLSEGPGRLSGCFTKWALSPSHPVKNDVTFKSPPSQTRKNTGITDKKGGLRFMVQRTGSPWFRLRRFRQPLIITVFVCLVPRKLYHPCATPGHRKGRKIRFVLLCLIGNGERVSIIRKATNKVRSRIKKGNEQYRRGMLQRDMMDLRGYPIQVKWAELAFRLMG
ncbi:hypothetical protein TNCV_5030581 [Trichonephila clavipes]|nr:hypothetical protein TNCV_5030581 [Trichonephila clavipes]